MKTMLYLALISFLFAACDYSKDETNNPDPDNNPQDFDIVGGCEMNYGPHDLAIKDHYLYACRDDKVYVFDIATPELPVLLSTIDDLEASNNFEALLVDQNTLYAACSASSGVYIFDISSPASPVKTGKFTQEIYSGNKLSAISLYANGTTLWAGGSNGSNALLVKLNVQNPQAVAAESYWKSTATGNIIGGIYANSANVFVSTANGHVYAFDANNIAGGPVGDYTFDAEAGHEHWGRSLLFADNKLFWADWGAGFITLNIDNPSNISASALITHSSYRAQFPDAEGTNVYDLAYDQASGKVYAANGWSGLLKINPDSPAQVEDYADYFETQFRCIALYGNYAITGDISTGTTNKAGLKVIKIK